MKNLLKIAVIATFGASPLAAQSMGGFQAGSVALEYETYDDGDGFNVTWIDASADLAYGLSDQFGVQLGLGYMKEIDSSDPFLDFRTITGVELHGFYDVTAEIRAGVMYAFDTYNDGDSFYGIEGIYLGGPIRVEGRYGVYQSDFEDVSLFEVNGAYDFGSGFSILGSFQNLDYGDVFGHYRLLALGASYDVTDALTVYGKYGWNENDFGFGDVYNGTNITLGVKASFGGSAADKMFTYDPFF